MNNKIKSVENFQKENELTKEMMDTLYEFYIGPYNEFKNISFVDFLYFIIDYEGSTIYAEILEDFVEW